jgi:predicted metalloprotease
MDLRNQRRSNNVEDQRGGRRLAVGGLGIGGVVVVIVVSKLLGVDTEQLFKLAEEGNQAVNGTMTQPSGAPTDDQGSDFVRAVLGSTEDAWESVFQEQGVKYPQPRLVLFRDQVQSACGSESAATGPFYCPADRKVYLDLSFFEMLTQRFGAPGDFAQAYVIAHEVGHHVQNVLGYNTRARAAPSGLGENATSVLLELQADCLAGVWANRGQRARSFLEQGDVEEAIKAASVIGDDALQRNSGRRVRPESFTHGSSAQRVKWFQIGMKQGTIASCDTFAAAR